jgi:hypothetical protein
VPENARVSGNTPDLAAPPPDKNPISITWENRERTAHFVQRCHRIANRTDAVRDFYDRIGARLGAAPKRIVITALGEGEFLITPLGES